MDLKQNLFKTCKLLILEPKKFWKELKLNIDTPEQSFLVTDPVRRFIIPLIILSGIAAFSGQIFQKEFLWSYAVLHAIREIICYFLQFYISVIVLYKLLIKYCIDPEKKIVTIIVAFSMLPSLLASIITRLVPETYAIKIFSLYGLYLFAVGASIMFEFTKENKSRYIILSILLLILSFGLLDTFTWRLSEIIFTNYVS